MGGSSSTVSKTEAIRVQPSMRNQVVPLVEATQAAQPAEDAARLRQQLQQEKQDHARALEAAAAANRAHLDAAAVAERMRLDSEAAAQRSRLNQEAADERSRLYQDAVADRERLDAEAAEERKRLDQEAEAERRHLAEAGAEAAEAERRILDRAATLERKRLDEEAGARRVQLDQEAEALRKRLDEEAETLRKHLDGEAAALRKQLDQEAEALRKRLDQEAEALRKQLDGQATAERTRLDEEAALERRRLNDVVAALQQQLQGLLTTLTSAGAAGAATARSSPVMQPMGLTPTTAMPMVATREISKPAPLSTATKPDADKGVAAVATAQPEKDRMATADTDQRRKHPEGERQAALEDAAAIERRKAEEEVERNWQEEDLQTTISSHSMQLEQLPASILDLHDGMPAHLRQAPMRLLKIDSVLSWPNIRVYEEVDTEQECLVVPYGDVDADTWNSTLILSWRWSASKPTEYTRGFAPMSELQYAELVTVLHRAKGQGIRHVWIDWCCVPQYASSPMVEVLRSKVFYARARGMVVLPTFVPIPTEGIVRLLLVKAMRVIRAHADRTSSPRCHVVLRLLETILEKQRVAGREYFTRVWTLAERMARFGRSENLCNWLSLENWLGMLVDAMLRSTEDRSAGEIYKRILGRDAGQRLDAILDPLEAAVKTGSMHVSEGLEDQVAELFELAVGIWHSHKELAEAPTKDWLVSYLLDAHAGIYQAWSEADRVWAVYSYFCWKQLDQRSDAGLLEALQDLVRVAGGSRQLLMCMATKLGLAKVIAPAEVDKKLITAAEANDTQQLVAALQEGAFPDFPGTDGGSALYFAAGKGNFEAVKMLLKYGANVNRVNVIGSTALHAATTNGNVDVIAALLKAGAGLDPKKQGGYTPLHLAAEAGHDAAVRALLQAGASKDDVEDNGKTALFLAATCNDTPDVVRVLLEAGANKDIKTKAGSSLLHGAARKGNEDMIRVLLHAGMSPNVVMPGDKAFTPLHIAAECGMAAAIRALAKAGAKLEANGSYGTALHRACICDKAEAVKALVECGASKESREPDDRKTPLMSAAHCGSAAAVKAMIEANADIEACDKDGWQPIHFAAKADSYECCKLLKDAGATTKRSTKGGNYPADLCKSSRVRNILPDGRNLLEAGGQALFKAFF